MLSSVVPLSMFPIFKSFLLVHWVLWKTAKFSKFFAIDKSLHRLAPFYKLNARTKRKTEHFSFLKHPFRQIFTNTARKTSIKMTDHPKLAVAAAAAAAATAAATPTAAAMTASEQQTRVRIRINE